MSGHSKWANIKRKKGKADEAKGKIYTKMAKFIQIAARDGADPNTNSKLKEAVAKAKANNMPNDNITRAIKKGAGENGGANFETVFYEGYGVGGIAVMVETLTDNRNRTAGDVRHAFDKCGGNLGTNGCVSFMFDEKGVILLDKDAGSEEELMDTALSAGAEDFNATEDGYEITTERADFFNICDAFDSLGIQPVSAEITRIPQTETELNDPELVGKFNKMLDMFDDNDDVQEVYHNAILPDDDEE